MRGGGWIASSDDVDQLVTAFVAALAEAQSLTRDKTATVPTKSGGEYTYNYNDLVDVSDAARSVLAKHGLAVSQVPGTNQAGDASVWTTILHTSGQWATTEPLVMKAGGTPQGTGSAITYARRYALLAVLGISTENADDDGAYAEMSVERQRAARASQNPPQRQGTAGPSRGSQGTTGANRGGSAPRGPSPKVQAIKDRIGELSALDWKHVMQEFRETFGCNPDALPAEREDEALTWSNEAVMRVTEPQPD